MAKAWLSTPMQRLIAQLIKMHTTHHVEASLQDGKPITGTQCKQRQLFTKPATTPQVHKWIEAQAACPRPEETRGHCTTPEPSKAMVKKRETHQLLCPSEWQKQGQCTFILINQVPSCIQIHLDPTPHHIAHAQIHFPMQLPKESVRGNPTALGRS